jgi:hypothetical protein
MEPNSIPYIGIQQYGMLDETQPHYIHARTNQIALDNEDQPHCIHSETNNTT